ncbi:hypothetical protein B0H10DRAFT_1811258, partial [Mycena sp. CBHHK59/15]
VTLAITSSVAFAIIVWEYAALLPDEIRLFRKHIWSTVPPYAFILLRYGGVLATLPGLFLSAVKTSNCQLAASLSHAGFIVVVISSGIIFSFRVSLLWGHNPVVRRGVGAGFIIMTVCWITVSTQYRTADGTPLFFGSNCRILPTVTWAPLGYASSTVFFITILVLTLLKMQYHHPRDSYAAYVLYRDNLAYLLATTLTIASMLIIQSLSPPSNPLTLSIEPFSTVIMVAMGVRVFRNFTLSTILEVERMQGLPYPSSSPITSQSDKFTYPSTPSAAIASNRMQRSPVRSPSSADGMTPNPYTASPSPPTSYAQSSLLSSPSNSPSSLSPLRRNAVRAVPEPPKSGWSDP